jgi:hypothetical protein
MSKDLTNFDLLGTIPDTEELARLVDNYPTYKWVHRSALLNGYFQGRTLAQLLKDKLSAKGLNADELSPQSLGGHGRWVREKVKKTIVRLLYLRYRIDDGFSRIESDQLLLKKFGTDAASDGGQSAIRKMTAGGKIDA